MKKLKFFSLCFLILTKALNSYEGQSDVDDLYASITNLANPSLDEYHRIENFLKNGSRPYLSELEAVAEKFSNPRRSCRQLKLVGDNGELPIYEVHHLGANISKERCIVLYASYNNPYPKMLRNVLQKLRLANFEGDVLVRIGGYPNMDNGGIKLCHIPYSWKIAFIYEAMTLGYKNILWIDTSMEPLNDLRAIFDLIEQYGYLFFHSGVNLDYAYSFGHHLDRAITANGVDLTDIAKIPHLASQIFGINANSSIAQTILADWLEKTQQVFPCMNPYPEELCYSIAAWKKGSTPQLHWGTVTCTAENKHLIDQFPLWSFLINLDH